jgi:branched-subunit amino acid transport protein
MEIMKGWLSNVLVAVLAAVMAIMQEVWIDTEYSFPTFLALGVSVGMALSLCAEIAKSVFWDLKWSWTDVATGALAGIVAAYIMALAIC